MKQVFNNFAKCGLFLALFLTMSEFAMAQRTIKGKVSDSESGDGLIGATVSVVGTPRGSVTDLDGNYSVDVPNGATQLRVSYTGYTEQVITLTSSNTVDVAMASGTALDEVVVVGYGSLKAKEVTSAVTSLKREDFNQGNISNAAQLLQGKVAGVTISRPGSDPNGEFTIRLRGLSSVSANQSPLIVLNGVPGASLNLIDPNDIESIDVLKDGSAAAIYGTRGSAGVIIITTKKGVPGKSTAEYSGSVAFDSPTRLPKTLNATEFLAAGGTDQSTGDVNTNWLDEITQTGVSQVHSLGFSGGAGTGAYRISFNYRNSDGILRTSGFDQYNTTISASQKVLNDRLTLSGTVNGTFRNSDLAFEDAFRYGVITNPTSPVFDAANAAYRSNGGYAETNSFDEFNPVAIIEQNNAKRTTQRLLGNVKADLEIAKGLIASVTVAQERGAIGQSEYYSKESKYSRQKPNGFAVRESYGNVNNLLEVTGNYSKPIGNNEFKLLVGYSWQGFENSGTRIEAGDILTNFFGSDNLNALSEIRKGLATTASWKNTNRLIAFFGRANFNIGELAYLQAGVRREGSSRFGNNNKWGIFPFASAGLNIHKLTNIAAFDQLKLRVGFGVTGSDAPESYLSKLVLSPGPSFYFDGDYVPSYGPTRNANPDLKWETKTEINAGLDWAVADYKVTGTFDVYSRKTEDLLLNFTVPQPPNLARTTWLNIAALTTRGFEATAQLNNLVSSEKFSWTPGLTFSTYKITLDDNGSKDTIKIGNVGAPGQNDVFYTIVYNGAPIGQLWGPIRESVNADGTIKYQDINGDNAIDIEAFNKDQTSIGNGIPKFEVGLNNSFKFGAVDFNFFLRGVLGHDLANEYRVFYENLDPSAKGWNKVKTEFYDPNVKAKNRFDNTHVENASFLRLDNLTLGYNMPVKREAAFSSVRVYVNGQNLATFTNYTGIDPEPRLFDPGTVDNGNRTDGSRNPLGNNPLLAGIDRRTGYFLARTISLGVNLGF
jgi:TonB-dependent starch-binding outer membrane protein SusC